MTKVLGITGGMGSGKTTITKFIESLGVPVYISDDKAKLILDTEDVHKEISKYFDVIEDGLVNRKKLASIVFNDKSKLDILNSIIHPKVAEDFENWKESYSDKPLVAKEAAILFETGGDKLCDFVMLVTAPEEIRLQRIVNRDNTDIKSAKMRISAQLSDKYKADLSDFIVENVDLDVAKAQARKIIEKIGKR